MGALLSVVLQRLTLRVFLANVGKCPTLAFVAIVIVVAFGVEVLAKAGFGHCGHRCYLGWLSLEMAEKVYAFEKILAVVIVSLLWLVTRLIHI